MKLNKRWTLAPPGPLGDVGLLYGSPSEAREVLASMGDPGDLEVRQVSVRTGQFFGRACLVLDEEVQGTV